MRSMISPREHRYVVVVTAPDRIGILSGICSALTDAEGNIDGLSQTVTKDYFTALLTVAFKTQSLPAEVETGIRKELKDSEANVTVMPYAERTAGAGIETVQPSVLTLIGKDTPGLLKCITGHLKNRNVNVTDWYMECPGEQVTHIGEIVVPVDVGIKQLQDELNAALSSFGVQCTIQHENIFRATNEVGPIEHLVEHKTNG